jgi:alanine racemase
MGQGSRGAVHSMVRAEARVDLAAIRDNVAALREHAGDAAVMAVVKADGYGHGMLPAARAALAGGAHWLGVAYPDEAVELRAAGITAPTLAWLVSPGECVVGAIQAGVDLAAYDVAALRHLAEQASRAGAPVRVHLKVDTGLSRGGATMRDWPELCRTAVALEAEGTVRAVGAWTHLVHAGLPDHPTTHEQVRLFREALAIAERAGLRVELRHLANSAATLTRPDARFDLVRPGLAVYGLSPVPQLGGPERYGLRPAMTLAACVALTKRVPAGAGVSYGHRYRTRAETTLALVPLGYADGVPRAATDTAQLWLAGRRRTVSGTVCMDQFVVDVGDDPVRAGDEVLLFGPGDAGEPTAEEWAQALGTISYEIVTRVGPRTPRVYLEGR